MNQAALYKRANKLQRHDAKRLMNEFADVLQLRPDGKDSLMDVGCGTGDVLMDFVYPILPKTLTKVIGIDISQNMIQHSKKKYADYEKVHFRVLDIGTDKMPLEYHEQFDLVTSFYCLHWVQDQRQALKNVHNMLLDNGSCLFIFVISSPVFDVYETLALDPQWREYMKDLDRFVPSLQKHPDAWLAGRKLFIEAGFVDPQVEIRQKAFIYENYDGFRNHMMSINPFLERMPLNVREEFMSKICEHWSKLGYVEKNRNKNIYRYIFPSKVLVAFAKKIHSN